MSTPDRLAPASAHGAGSGRRRRLERALGIALLGFQTAVLLAQVAIEQAGTAAGGPDGLRLLGSALDVASTLSFAIVGVVIIFKRPGNVIGWLFAVANLGWVISNASATYAQSSLTVAPLPATAAAGWLATWPGPLSLAAYYLIVLLFPDGRPLSGRWSRFAALAAGFAIAQALMMAFGSGPVGSLQLRGLDYPNPLGIDGALGTALGDAANGPMQLGILAILGTSALSMVLRMRRSNGVEREQLKWLSWAVVVTVACWVTDVPMMFAYDNLAAAPPLLRAWNAIATSSGVIIPIAAGVAILRFHLYEIDRILSRTVAWAVLTAVLLLVFGGAVVGLDDLLAGVTQGGTLAVAASTLAAFALFQPLRRRVQAAVDRRFDRARYDAQRIVDAFADGLRGEVDLTQINDGVLTAVATTVRPRSEAVWLRERRR